ncbi:hypothetical protein Gasu2_63720 [Galdieria sulphuraria]|uniref:CHCH domain-containing protein n=1 Tax=Galdieria sulphuraria TaxID=130081 RepID=M2XEJ9_GALSU|nr:uncharacterized protein Gasu_40830 [Galdieria sulphuraria]EME28387.1 hypothetical protein Gasu_40830 [Galdieria sulphuraria]GJD12274.1 hypothetical protein Gasu2_63720 [Galdieria sulphuraria]|eukprot:XP_005704907.1 hypothetical protein Gasu_40830 [Galdieria sulphuraria]
MRRGIEEVMTSKSSVSASESLEEERDVEDMIDSSICAQVYRKLEDCLADNDRNWSACQEQVKALKECYKKTTLRSPKVDK